MTDNQKIKGKFLHTVYRQDSNTFTIARFRLYELNEKDIVVTGYLPIMPKNTLFVLTGNYIEHPKYGLQFAVESYQQQLPTDEESLISYLSSPLFPGIGKIYAKTVIDTLGLEAIDRIKEDPTLIDTLPKINAKRKKALIEGICEQDDLGEAIQFFSTHGLGVRNIFRIDRAYGKDALRLIKENPYRLVEEVDGIGFKTADMLAMSMGIAPDDIRRIEAAVLSVLLDRCIRTGDSYLLYDEFRRAAERELSGVFFDFEEVVFALSKRRQLIIEEDRVYHFTQYDAEETISGYFNALRESTYEEPDEDEIRQHLHQFQEEIHIVYDEMQVQAINTFFREDVMILTGGPGTGKTTVVRAMVELFKRLFPYFSIALCAPTGRAAKRLSELTKTQATTIHSLLQWDMETNTFGCNEENPLTRDLLIVDEFSMVDQWLLYNLLKAGRHFKKILIIGDEDQLPSVGIGCVLKDLIASNIFPLVRLLKIFRQEEGSDVITLAHQVKNGACGILSNGKDIKFMEANQYEAKEILLALMDEALLRGYGINEIQVLAPKYSGICGIDALNNALQKVVNPHDRMKRELRIGYAIYREGDKILQLKNQPEDDVYNGDIGILIEIVYASEAEDNRDTLIVDFEGIIVEYNHDTFIHIAHAYCISIHKAQGSEYPIVLMPILRQDKRMLNRRLLYTGITRASKSLVLVGERDVFEYGINAPEFRERRTTLTERLIFKATEMKDVLSIE